MKSWQRIAGVAGICLFGMTAAVLAESNGRPPGTAAGVSTAAPVSGVCTSMPAVNFRTDDAINESTTSTSFVDVPNTKITFTQGGTGKGCVIVTFSSESWAPGAELMIMRARLDSAVIGLPGVIQFSGGDGRWAASRAFTFIFQSVAPGAHTVSVQYASWFVGDRVNIGKHTTLVQHP